MEDEIKLVAAFMGIPIRSYYGGVFYISDEDGYVDFDNNPEVYRPSKNWSQLMPVVEKIASLGIGSEFRIDSNGSSFMHIHHTKGVTESISVAQTKEHKPISTAHKAVLEFIKWYRSQPEGNTVNMK